MLYDVGLTITYEYAVPADAGRHLVRLMPADLPGEQRAIAGTLTVAPRPQEWIDRIDFFGNRYTELLFDKPHEEIAFTMQARVDRQGPGSRLDMSPPLAVLAQEIRGGPTRAAQSGLQYTYYFSGVNGRLAGTGPGVGGAELASKGESGVPPSGGPRGSDPATRSVGGRRR